MKLWSKQENLLMMYGKHLIYLIIYKNSSKRKYKYSIYEYYFKKK